MVIFAFPRSHKAHTFPLESAVMEGFTQEFELVASIARGTSVKDWLSAAPALKYILLQTTVEALLM
jgi:hypothetical protein